MTSDGTESLIYDKQGSTVVLTMNRPDKRNALTLDMIVRFADAWDAVEATTPKCAAPSSPGPATRTASVAIWPRDGWAATRPG